MEHFVLICMIFFFHFIFDFFYYIARCPFCKYGLYLDGMQRKSGSIKNVYRI